MDAFGGLLFAFLALFEPSGELPQTPVVDKPEMVQPEVSRPQIDKPKIDKPETAIYHIPLNKELEACDKYDPLFINASQRYAPWGHKEEFARWLKAQAFAESSCRPDVCSPAGACGIMQILKGTADDLGVADRMDPRQSIKGGAKYMDWLYGQWRAHDRTPEQRQELALGCYNWGLGNFLDLQRKYGCINYDCFQDYVPEETENYVMRISDLVE